MFQISIPHLFSIHLKFYINITLVLESLKTTKSISHLVSESEPALLQAIFSSTFFLVMQVDADGEQQMFILN